MLALLLILIDFTNQLGQVLHGLLPLLGHFVRVYHSLPREEAPLLVLNEGQVVVLALVITLETLDAVLLPVDKDVVLLDQREHFPLHFA